jgi:RimJ/RimL family protein N-acetyltransferase
MIFETQRLILREMTPADDRHLYALNYDPEVIKYTGDPAFQNVAEARSFLENYDQYRKYGFGRWAVIDKKEGVFLGWCGLKYDAAIDETDIGFRFCKKYWNRGFATESAKACLAYGFDQLTMETIVGRAMKENTASIKVLEKLGMQFDREFDFYRGHSGVVYKMEKKNFKID